MVTSSRYDGCSKARISVFFHDNLVPAFDNFILRNLQDRS